MSGLRRIRFSDLIREIHGSRIYGNDNPIITSIEYDSRRSKEGSLFIAMRGLKTDGAEFIRDAIARGAAAVITESMQPGLSLPYAVVPDSRKALAESAWSFYGHPEQNLILAAVTGTNGKTTITSLLSYVLEQSGLRTGTIGTLGISCGELDIESPRTTPESVEIAAYLAEMIERGITHVVMEATSIGIDLERVYKMPFRTTIFTNLTRDHLDYHGSWEAYRAAKIRLFAEQSPKGTAIVNVDDPEAMRFIHAASAKTITYGADKAADFRAVNIRLQRDGIHFNLVHDGRIFSVRSPFVGRFNVYNSLAVIAAAQSLGISIESACDSLLKSKPVRGRAEAIQSRAPFTIIIDYAHTPDALEKILGTLNTLQHNRIITIIGAGGNRDRGKRPLMAQTAFRFSDRLYLTSDNPRDENPESILDDMAEGIADQQGFIRNTDRKTTIQNALAEATAGDIILIAGKGHETYQEISGVKYPFDDRQVALEWLTRAGYVL